MMLLTITDLHVYYGHIHAVKGISFSLAAGETMTLIGSNGAGKSSTIKAICGLAKPRQGSILFDGYDITGWSPERIVRAGIGYVPEGRRVFSQMSVYENLLVGAYTQHNAKERIDYVYTLFPILKERHNKLAGGLSGGEQQMLSLGRALMTRPRLLVLDEPSLGLAPLIVKQVFSLLSSLNKSLGLSILLVEQNARLALQTANHAVAMETGQVRMVGPASELASNPIIQDIYLGGRAEKKTTEPLSTNG
jgi:branched-chain amino acid transport system ATP-binding protein